MPACSYYCQSPLSSRLCRLLLQLRRTSAHRTSLIIILAAGVAAFTSWATLTGYTAKLAGTETGVTEPQPNFSTCFGSPFLPLRPKVYAKMLGERLKEHGAQCWLVNTGWSGGAYGIGKRMSLPYTRAMVRSTLRTRHMAWTCMKRTPSARWISAAFTGCPKTAS